MKNRDQVIYRRRQVMYQKIVLTIVTTCIIICGVLLGSSMISAGRSKASEQPENFKYYTSIQIENGDTLWSIANEYISDEYESIQEYIDEVKCINQLGPDDIHAGQYLTVPYYSATFQ